MHLAIMKNKGIKNINDGFNNNNDKLRFQLVYDRAQWKTYRTIQEKLDRIVLEMSNFISTSEIYSFAFGDVHSAITCGMWNSRRTL